MVSTDSSESPEGSTGSELIVPDAVVRQVAGMGFEPTTFGL